MLQKHTASILNEHSWKYYINKEENNNQGISGEKKKGNPSLSFSRVKNQTENAFIQMALLARRLPQDKFRDLFNIGNISKLLKAMLIYEHDSKSESVDRLPDLRLAEFLVQYGLDIMIKEYKKISGYTPEIAQLTLDHLSKTKAICHDISLNVETINLETEAKQNKLRYLFTWERIDKEDRQRFENFVFELICDGDSKKIAAIKRENEIKYFTIGIGGLAALMTPLNIKPENEDDFIIEGNIELVQDIPKSTADLDIAITGRKIKRTLNMEYRNNDYYFYDKLK